MYKRSLEDNSNDLEALSTSPILSMEILSSGQSPSRT